MRLGDHMCIVPFASSSSRSRDHARLPILHKREPQTDSTEECVGQEAKDVPKKKTQADWKGTPKNSKLEKKKSRISYKENDPLPAQDSFSDRITFSKLMIILKDAYVTTMKSFAGKPGGLGGMVMGGKIDLPDATPSRTFKEPRNFVRSWSKGRPAHCPSPISDFAQRANPHGFAG